MGNHGYHMVPHGIDMGDCGQTIKTHGKTHGVVSNTMVYPWHSMERAWILK